jgi:hypothetical protein
MAARKKLTSNRVIIYVLTTGQQKKLFIEHVILMFLPKYVLPKLFPHSLMGRGNSFGRTNFGIIIYSVILITNFS